MCNMSDGLSVAWRVKLALGVSLYTPGAARTANCSWRLPRVGSFERKMKKPNMSIEKHM